MAAGKMVRAAAELLRILGDDLCAVAGGMAVNAHGFVRATRDVDVIVTFPLDDARGRLERHGIKVRLFRGDPREGDFACLKGIIGVGAGRGKVLGVPFDVRPELVPLEPERTIELTLRDQRLRVVDLETLIRLKLKASSQKDLYDVAILAHLHPSWKERAKALARHDAALGGRFASLIEDPRVAAQAREVRRQDQALQEFAQRQARKRGSRREN